MAMTVPDMFLSGSVAAGIADLLLPILGWCQPIAECCNGSVATVWVVNKCYVRLVCLIRLKHLLTMLRSVRYYECSRQGLTYRSVLTLHLGSLIRLIT